MRTRGYGADAYRARRPNATERANAAAARISYFKGELLNGWDVAIRLGLAEQRLAEMAAWFSQHPEQANDPDLRETERQTRAVAVDARLDFLDMAAKAVNGWGIVKNDDSDRDLGLELYEQTGVDLRIEGRGEPIYRRQWRDVLTVNPVPCPF